MRSFSASPTFSALIGLTLIAVIPLFITSDYRLSVLTTIGIYTIVAVGLNLLMGYAGQVSLGHAAFFGIGAYTSAILTCPYEPTPNFPSWLPGILCRISQGLLTCGRTLGHLSPWYAVGIGVLLTMAIAALVGLPCLRLKGHYLAMATLGFGGIVYTILKNWQSLTQGPSGIMDIPSFTLGSTVIHSDTAHFRLVWVIAVLVLLMSANLVRSRVGRAFRALHTSEPAAAALGVDIAGYKLTAFVLSAAYASLAGSLYAHTMNYVNPESFAFIVSVELVVMVVIGGMASIWGAVIGAGTITILVEWLRGLGQVRPQFQEAEVIAHGAILIIIIIFMPSGLTAGVRDAVIRWWRQGDEEKSEVRSQKSEVRSQRSEIRSQRSEVRSQKTERRGQKAGGGES